MTINWKWRRIWTSIGRPVKSGFIGFTQTLHSNDYMVQVLHFHQNQMVLGRKSILQIYR